MLGRVPLIPAKELMIEFHPLGGLSFVEVVHVKLSEESIPAG
jgi:hypothetical protein